MAKPKSKLKSKRPSRLAGVPNVAPFVLPAHLVTVRRRFNLGASYGFGRAQRPSSAVTLVHQGAAGTLDVALSVRFRVGSSDEEYAARAPLGQWIAHSAREDESFFQLDLGKWLVEFTLSRPQRVQLIEWLRTDEPPGGDTESGYFYTHRGAPKSVAGLAGFIREYVLFKTVLPVVEVDGPDTFWDIEELEVEVVLKRDSSGVWRAQVRVTDTERGEDPNGASAAWWYRTAAIVGAYDWKAGRLLLLGGDTSRSWYSQNADDGSVRLDITKLAGPVQVALDMANDGNWAELDKLPAQLAGLRPGGLMARLRGRR